MDIFVFFFIPLHCKHASHTIGGVLGEYITDAIRLT